MQTFQVAQLLSFFFKVQDEAVEPGMCRLFAQSGDEARAEGGREGEPAGGLDEGPEWLN